MLELYICEEKNVYWAAVRKQLVTSWLVCVRVDVVMCLSTMVRNDTLQEVRDQRVSVKCRKQLRVEEVEMVGLLQLQTPKIVTVVQKTVFGDI